MAEPSDGGGGAGSGEPAAVAETVVASNATVVDFDVHGDCLVFVDSAGILAVAPASGGAPEPLTTLPAATSLATTPGHILVSAAGEITRIPWNTNP